MTTPPPFNAEFERACDKAFHDKCREVAFDTLQQEACIAAGNMDESQATRTVNAGRINAAKNNSNNAKNNQNKSSMLLLLLDQMDRQLNVINAQMADMFKGLQATYGDDVVTGIAETFLAPDVLKDLKTDNDKLQALADKFLNSDGTLKEKYQDLPEAKYVQKWQKAQQLLDKRAELVQANKLEHKQEIAQGIDDDVGHHATGKNDLNFQFS